MVVIKLAGHARIDEIVRARRWPPSQRRFERSCLFCHIVSASRTLNRLNMALLHILRRWDAGTP
jgi:hypothetical protein